ncbi:MAG: pyridoxine 5'-phosphate synthase [Acidobacteria bacterium]|nr:pyridoxine 5'-phosphate synthase [Acidobacteriota bacterium]MCB9378814.1 pyridoxine 5'-phosphate synthase [Holophagales bacterium]
MVRLSVNVNKVATLRNARGGDRPSVRHAAEVAVGAGCQGITVHPRPDERHIRRSDVLELAEWLPVELNIEGYPGPEWIELVETVRPAQATLVPDPPDVLTSNAGWRFGSVDRSWLSEVVARLRETGARVSLFLDPDPREVEGADAAGADRIELYTEGYARAFPTSERDAVFATYRATAEAAVAAGLGINAGHDLDLENLPHLAANLPGLEEVSIGHALISDALDLGLAATVRAYLDALRPSPPTR